jgi:energy-coupling factor transporter ATP-binding protein EcfA2
MKPLPNEVIFISGQRGSGKSYFAKQLARTLPRCIIWDTLGEYQVDRRIFDLDDLIDFLIEDQKNPHFFSVAYDSHQPVDDFPDFCRAILARGDIYLVVEELDLLSTPFQTPVEFAKLIKYGRHYGIQLVGVSRRPAEISRLFTSQCSRFVIFNQREPKDIVYFRSIIGDAANKLPTMPVYNYLDIDFSTQPIDVEIKSPI